MSIVESLFFGLIDFIILLIPLIIVSFVLYKMLSPLRIWLAEKYSLSWTKSCLLLNFFLFFVFFVLVFIYYYFLGSAMALPIDPEVKFNLIDDLVVIIIASVRIIVASMILSLIFYFFELLSSFVMDATQRKGKSSFTSQIIGVSVSACIFLVLVLFVFNWALLGLFIYIFYGGVNPLPLVI